MEHLNLARNLAISCLNSRILRNSHAMQHTSIIVKLEDADT